MGIGIELAGKGLQAQIACPLLLQDAVRRNIYQLELFIPTIIEKVVDDQSGHHQRILLLCRKSYSVLTLGILGASLFTGFSGNT